VTRKTLRAAIVLFLCINPTKALFAQGTSEQATPLGVQPVSNEEAAKQKDATIDFQGAGFGAGLAVIVNLSGHKRVSDAQVAGGVVRVTKQNDRTPRVLLNLHYFFSGVCNKAYRLKLEGKVDETVKQAAGKWCVVSQITDNDNGGKNANHLTLTPMRGWGPFIAVQPGSEQTVQAVGAGILYGFRRQADKTDSFNLGIGIVLEQNVKELGDGIEANKAATRRGDASTVQGIGKSRLAYNGFLGFLIWQAQPERETGLFESE
jgi:hypothetical protein